MGFYVIKHTDGNIMPILDQIVETHPHALHSLDPQAGVDIAKVKCLVGNKVCLIGNVNCGILQTETKQEVIDLARYGWRTTEFPVKTGEDIEKAIWLYENTYYVFIKKNFKKGSKFFKDRGEPQFFVPRSGYQHLAIRVMGVENLIYALSDFPKKVERLMQAIDNSYDTLYKDIVSYGKVKIINFGGRI